MQRACERLNNRLGPSVAADAGEGCKGAAVEHRGVGRLAFWPSGTPDQRVRMGFDLFKNSVKILSLNVGQISQNHTKMRNRGR